MRGMGLGAVPARELSCRGSRAGCIGENGGRKPPVLVRRRHAWHYSVGSSDLLRRPLR